MSAATDSPLWPRLLPLLGARAIVGVFLVLGLAPICVDDYFRVFHADWWWDHPSFTSSHEWLPGYLYVYGPVVGFTHDLVVAPRVLTTALQLVAGALIALLPNAARGTRLLAAGIFLFSPLSLALGTAPLSETLLFCLLVAGVGALARYLASGDVRIGLVAAVLYLAATAVRYEGFVFAAVFFALVVARRPANAGRWLGVAVAAVPWIFPIAWTALLWASVGAPFSYLGSVRDDHFGPGDVLGSLASAEGAVTALLALAALAVSAVRVAASAVRGELGGRVLELHTVVAMALAGAVILTGNVPSQYPLRLLFPVIAFGALPLAEAAFARFAAHPRAAVLAVAGAALSFAGAGLAVVSRAPGVPAEDLEVAAAIREGYSSGTLRDEEHVVIQRDLPSAAAVFVFANLDDRVHVDALGVRCPARLLTASPALCPDPDWARRARVAVVRAGGFEELYVARLGWTLGKTAGRWRLYVWREGAPGLAKGAVFRIRDRRAPPW